MNKKPNRKMMFRAKTALINKIVQDFAARNGVDFPRQNCRKASVSAVASAIVMPVSAAEKFTIDYKGKFYAKAKGSRNHLELSDKLCGKKRPRKLNKILGSLLNDHDYTRYHNVVKIYNIHKKLFKIDNIYKVVDQYLQSSNFPWEFLLERGGDYNNPTDYLSYYKEFVTYVGEDRAINLILKGFQSWECRDFLSQWYDRRTEISIADNDLNTIRKLHDYVSREYRKRKDPDFNLLENWDEGSFQDIDNLKVGDLTIVVPKTRDELVDWGGIMHNCVASFARSMYDGHCLLLGVKRHDELIYNIEINPIGKKLIQFFGKRNSSPIPQDRGAIVTVLARLDYLNKNLAINFGTIEDYANEAIEVFQNELAF